eukprot:9818434-Lingulodinium_polyedra.AAC.1
MPPSTTSHPATTIERASFCFGRVPVCGRQREGNPAAARALHCCPSSWAPLGFCARLSGAQCIKSKQSKTHRESKRTRATNTDRRYER